MAQESFRLLFLATWPDWGTKSGAAVSHTYWLIRPLDPAWLMSAFIQLFDRWYCGQQGSDQYFPLSQSCPRSAYNRALQAFCLIPWFGSPASYRCSPKVRMLHEGLFVLGSGWQCLSLLSSRLLDINSEHYIYIIWSMSFELVHFELNAYIDAVWRQIQYIDMHAICIAFFLLKIYILLFDQIIFKAVCCKCYKCTHAFFHGGICSL